MKKHLYIILFTISLFHSSLFAQWLQQTLPVSGHINDMVFLNKDTGFVAMDNSNFLRTTNGGTNWTLSSNFRILILNKIDSVTAYGMGAINSKIYRTFNGGTTWDSVSPVGTMCWISFISRDTGWISSLGGIYKTTNGGLTASFIYNQSPINCGRINFLMLNYSSQNFGLFVDNSGFQHKTTNSGLNWTPLIGIGPQTIYNFFLNKDTGWIPNSGNILYTSNSGNNWINQFNSGSNLYEIYFYNFQKGWCGSEFFNIYVTTNGGINWGYQNSPILSPGGLYFVDSSLGWAYNGFTINNLIKTTNGGGNITYSAIEPIGSVIPHEYKLKQNYPNPFNPGTDIEFSLPTRSFIKIIIYDILGRVIEVLAEEELTAGTYNVEWNASKYSSGIYYYTLITENYMETKKMILIK